MLKMGSRRAKCKYRDQLGFYCNNPGEKMGGINFSPEKKGAEMGEERKSKEKV